MSQTAKQRARSVARSRGQLAMLERAGIDLREVGRVFNRANVQADDDLSNVAVPDTVAGMEEALGDVNQLHRYAKAGKLKALIGAYARKQIDTDMDVRRQVAEQTQATLQEWLQNAQADGLGPSVALNLAGDDGGRSAWEFAKSKDATARARLYNKTAMGAKLDKDFGNSAEYWKTIWHMAPHTADLQEKRGRLRNAFSSNVPSEGGFLIPETLRSEILRLSLETSLVRPRARVIPMETLRVPFPAIDSTSNASSVYGGIQAYWTEEGAGLTATSASFSNVVLDAKKLTTYCEVPNELIADSIGSFEALMDEIFPEAMGFYEDYAFMQGSGVGEPLGIFNAGNKALVATAAETGQASATIVWENIVKMFARMLPASLSRAVWVASIDTFPELATMSLSVGTGGSAIWINNGVEGPPMTILGRPVMFTEKTSVLGGLGDINFVDFGMYLLGDRQAMSSTSSPHFKFANDVTAFKVIERVDGRPWLKSAITPKNGGNTLSPFVQLAARP